MRCKACKAEVAREARAKAKRTPAPVVEIRPGLRLVVETPAEPAPEAVTDSAPVRQDTGGGRHRTAFETALAAADWINGTHAAAVEYARSLADLLDAASLEGILPGRAEPQYLLALKALGLHYVAPVKAAEAPAAPMLNVSNY